METPTSVEASSDEPDVGGLAEQLASASVSEGKKTGKTVKEWSRAVKLIDSKTIQHEFLHPACLEFAPADLDSRYSSVMRCISPAFFVVGLYKIIPEGANEAQGADEQTSKAKESDGESSTEAAEEGDEEVSSCGEFPTSRKQERKGGISLYRLEYPKLVWKEDDLQDYGVYDLKFLPYHSIFAASTTIGTIVIYQLEEKEHTEGSERELTIRKIKSHDIFPSKNLITSIAWQPLQNGYDSTRILAITVDNSGVYLLRFSVEFDSYEVLNHKRSLHDHILTTRFFETKESAYACAFSPRLPYVVFSGGDDSLLRGSTLSPCVCPLQTANGVCTTPPTGNASTSYTAAIAKSGVTSILPLPIYNTRFLLVGSYDGNVYLCSLSADYTTFEDGTSENTYPPRFDTIVSHLLDGGVYHMKSLLPYPDVQNKPDMEVSFQFLACCMDAGAKIVEVRRKDGVWSFSILASFKDLVYVEEDKMSVCYAGDVQPLYLQLGEKTPSPLYSGKRICVTSSYDNSKLSLWSFDTTVGVE